MVALPNSAVLLFTIAKNAIRNATPAFITCAGLFAAQVQDATYSIDLCCGSVNDNESKPPLICVGHE
jgi:hypothetical protein